MLYYCVMQIYAKADLLTVRCLEWFYWHQCNSHSYNRTIVLLTLCMRFMHTTSRISSSVISAVLIVCITCLIQFAFFCRVIRITSLKLHFVISREQWSNLYESLKAQSELRIQRLGRDLFVSSGIKSTMIFQKARNVQRYWVNYILICWNILQELKGNFLYMYILCTCEIKK